MTASSLDRPKLPSGFSYSKRDINSLLTLYKEELDGGSICHVGSKLHGDDVSVDTEKRWRSNFHRKGLKEFVGVDLFEGLNVDVTGDLCDDDFYRKNPYLEKKFDLVFSSALFEHVENPFKCAATVRRLIKPNGLLYFGGPWACGYHAYPDDYWRISFSGIRVLFPDLIWLHKWYGGTNDKETIDFEDQIKERKLFSFSSKTAAPVRFSDRSMSFLMVCALGRAPPS